MRPAAVSVLDFFIILHHTQDKRDVDVSFHRMFCIRHKALQIMHHVNDVVQSVLYLFYFLALPFFNPFYFLTVLFYSNHYDLQAKLLPTQIYWVGICFLDIQQLLLTIAFAC